MSIKLYLKEKNENYTNIKDWFHFLEWYSINKKFVSYIINYNLLIMFYLNRIIVCLIILFIIKILMYENFCIVYRMLIYLLNIFERWILETNIKIDI